MSKQFLLRELGHNIHNIRIQTKVSVDELSAKTKIRVSYLNKIENGEAKRIPFPYIIAIAEVLGVEPKEFF